MSPQSIQDISTSASTLGYLYVPAVSPLSETNNPHIVTREHEAIKNTTLYPGYIGMPYRSQTETKTIKYSNEFEKKFDDKFYQLILDLNNEIYEDSDENTTFNKLSEILNEYGEYFIQSVLASILYNRYDPILLSKILSKLGPIGQQSYYVKSILWILQCSIFLDNPKIKYGAILGLSYIKPKSALSRLELAFRNESNPILKTDIENLISKIRT